MKLVRERIFSRRTPTKGSDLKLVACNEVVPYISALNTKSIHDSYIEVDTLIHPLMFFFICLGAEQTGNYPYSLVLFKIGLLINFR